MLKEGSEAPEGQKKVDDERKFGFTESYIEGMIHNYDKESYSPEDIRELFDIGNLLLQENKALKTENLTLAEQLEYSNSELARIKKERAEEERKREQKSIEHDWYVDHVF
jgi:hypothetical protein